ncbi:MAG: type III pantothenate kinase [Gammaproteobacteria bacterium]
MNLLVDIGNTRFKWGRVDRGSIETGEPIRHAADLKRQLFSVWCELKPVPRRIAVSCVSSESVLAEVKAVAFELWPEVDWVRVKSKASAYGVVNAYPQPDKLGVDRWLCLLAARRLWRQPVCIVDCGTAITLDVMTEEGRHLGGLISPGLTLMKQCLSKGTAELPFSDRVFAVGLADTTDSAIFSGTLYAAVGLINTFLGQRSEALKLILTGGDAEIIAGHLDHDFVIEPDLVLQGLAVVLED